jgi:hypothetical protein
MITLLIIDAFFKMLLAGLMGSICGMFIYFIDYTFWPGSIFKFYLPWLAKTLLKSFKPLIYKHILDLKSTLSKEDYEEILKDEAAKNVFFYKMLGGCPVCFGMWIAILSYVIICATTWLEWYYIFPYIFISSWQIRKLVGATYSHEEPEKL